MKQTQARSGSTSALKKRYWLVATAIVRVSNSFRTVRMRCWKPVNVMGYWAAKVASTSSYMGPGLMLLTPVDRSARKAWILFLGRILLQSAATRSGASVWASSRC